jgi:hypothetical protein
MKIKGMPAMLLEVNSDFPVQNHPGYMGAFTRDTATGALPSKTRVRKVNSEPGDGQVNGVMGTVLGSISHPDVLGGATCYFIEWDTRPRMAVSVMGFKVEEVA